MSRTVKYFSLRKLNWWILKHLDQATVEEYAKDVLELMDEDSWNEARAEERAERYDAMD